MKDAKSAIGYRSHLSPEALEAERRRLVRHAHLQLAALGLPSSFEEEERELSEISVARFSFVPGTCMSCR